MSRVGKAPIPIPKGVSVSIGDDKVVVTGPKGELSQSIPEGIRISQTEEEIRVERSGDERESRSLHGLMRALLNNMVIGVSQGYQRELEIVGVGYRAAAAGDRKLELQLGFSHPVKVEAPEGISFEVPQPTLIRVCGIDKQKVGQTAAEIRALRKPEPYKGKGIRHAGEFVRRKAGKAAT